MTHEQKEKKLYDDCMADPNVTESMIKGKKEDQCKDNTWYAWLVGI